MKKAPKGLLFFPNNRYGKKVVWLVTEVLRQEPGKYFGGKLSAGPQTHAAIVPPGVGVVIASEALAAANTIDAFAGIFELRAVAFATTLIEPLALVCTFETNLEVATEDSHPHAPAAGRVLEVVCTVSVTAVRHWEAARITSDTRARTV